MQRECGKVKSDEDEEEQSELNAKNKAQAKEINEMIANNMQRICHDLFVHAFIGQTLSISIVIRLFIMTLILIIYITQRTIVYSDCLSNGPCSGLSNFERLLH